MFNMCDFVPNAFAFIDGVAVGMQLTHLNELTIITVTARLRFLGPRDQLFASVRIL